MEGTFDDADFAFDFHIGTAQDIPYQYRRDHHTEPQKCQENRGKQAAGQGPPARPRTAAEPSGMRRESGR